MSSRLVVVCRPLSSFRKPLVTNSVPAKRLIRVDLPTPEEPMKAAVLPHFRQGSICSWPASASEEVTSISAPMATDSAAAFLAATSLHKSALVKMTIGSAPLLQAMAKYRSRRRRLKSLFNDIQMNIVSILLATTCSALPVPAALRINALLRRSTWWMIALPSKVSGRSSRTKSPTAGKSESAAALKRSLPETSANTSPVSVMTR